jgi:hypothetical protein
MIVKDPEIQGGIRTFKGTRIPSGLSIGSGNPECLARRSWLAREQKL